LATVRSTNNRGNGGGPTEGGGIFNNLGIVSINNSTLNDNLGVLIGGGIYNTMGFVSVSNSTLSGDVAVDGSGNQMLHRSTQNSHCRGLAARLPAALGVPGGGAHNP
jgi:hypothetical protein